MTQSQTTGGTEGPQRAGRRRYAAGRHGDRVRRLNRIGGNRTTPEPLTQRLNAALADVIGQPQVRKDIETADGIPAQPMARAQADRFFSSEIARNRNIAKAIGPKPE